MTDTIVVDRSQHIVTVTLNRPDKLNAITLEMYGRFGEVFEELCADESVRCVVVRGAGNRAFSGGADISEFRADRADVKQAKEYSDFTLQATNKLRYCPHPTIALIQGLCVGGGLEVASMCDLRICGESSRFGIPINRLGLTVDYDDLRLLIDRIGARTALEILIEGRLFSAEEALQKGLVSRIVPDDQVEEEVYATAQHIAGTAPLVNRWHKKFVRRLLDPKPLSASERDEAFECYDTEDYEIGCASFLEKKKPEFKGR